MRVLIIFAVATLTAAAPQFPKQTEEYAAEPIRGIISEDSKELEIYKVLRTQRFLRSIDDSETTTDDVNEGVSAANDLSKEIAEEMSWAAEEKKWQEQAKAETLLATLDGEAASNNAHTEVSDSKDTEEDLEEESLWLADEMKWDEQEIEGTEAAELEDDGSHVEKDSEEAGESTGSVTPAVLVYGGGNLTYSKDVEIFVPQLPLIPNNVLPWNYAGIWINQFPQYYNVPDIRVSTY